MRQKHSEGGRLIAAFLLAALLIGALILVFHTVSLLLRAVPAPEPQPEPEITAPEPEPQPEYGVWGPVLSELPPNPYAAEAFSVTNGRVSHPDALQGIDVSAHNGEIDWDAVRDAGIDFAILQVGYRGYSIGSVSTDARFFENADAAVSRGIGIGVYFFSQCLNTDEAAAEAEYVVSLLKGMQIDWPVFFDWEPVSDARTDEMDVMRLTDCALTFCRIVEEAGFRAGVYFNQEYAYRHYDLVALKDYDFWLAEYADAPSFYYDMALWQYRCTGSVPGIEGEVDLNLSFRDYRKP